jgi:hypothetical protein
MASEEQIKLAERLQERLLKRFEKLMEEGDDTPTDRATLSRLLNSNGWSLSPDSLPAELKDFITKKVDPRSLDDED